jgi:hypothetical protein
MYTTFIVIDPRNPNRAYCGTFGDGLWKSEDIGQTWNRIGKDVITCNDIISVSVSPIKIMEPVCGVARRQYSLTSISRITNNVRTLLWYELSMGDGVT